MPTRLPARDYRIAWHWRDDDPTDPLKTDEVRATTVTRAVNKLIKALTEEYADVRANLIVIEVALAN